MFQATLARDPHAPLIHYFDQTVTAAQSTRCRTRWPWRCSGAASEHGERVAMYLQNIPAGLRRGAGRLEVRRGDRAVQPDAARARADEDPRRLGMPVPGLSGRPLRGRGAAPRLPSTAVQHVITTSPLHSSIRARPAPRALAGWSRLRHRDAVDLADLVERQRRTVRRSRCRAHRRRRRAHGLHVGHDRRPEGGHEHPPERRVRDHRSTKPGSA